MSSTKKKDLIDFLISALEAYLTPVDYNKQLVQVLRKMNKKIKDLEKELDKKAKKMSVIGPSPDVIDN